jgi:hypothetical protein
MNDKLQEKCQLLTELYKIITAFLSVIITSLAAFIQHRLSVSKLTENNSLKADEGWTVCFS